MLKKLSIIIPVYNEEKTILEVLEEVGKVDLSGFKLEKEIIVVDDGSIDNTAELLKKKSQLYTKLIQKNNEGKGSALIRGFKEAMGDIILIQDADVEYPPSNYASLLRPFFQNNASVVYGSRFKGQRFFSRQKWFNKSHFLGNKFLSTASSLLFFKYITDMETGHKCFTRDALDGIVLTEKDFRIEPEITAKILKKGIKIKEVPISYNPRSFNEGKKIRWHDGLLALLALIKYRFFK